MFKIFSRPQVNLEDFLKFEKVAAYVSERNLDEEILEQARIAAVDIVNKDPELDSNPALARAVQSLIDQARAEFVKKSWPE